MKRIIVILFSIMLLLAGCSDMPEADKEEPKVTKKEKKGKTTESPAPPPFEDYVSGIHGKSFLKESTLEDGVVTLVYHGSYEEYKKDNPKSPIDEMTFDTYWKGTQNDPKRLETNLVRGFTESLRIARLYPEVKEIYIEIPVDGKIYSFESSREQLEQFFKVNLDDLNKAYHQGDTSLAEYIDPVVSKDDQRKKFMDTFVTIH